MHFQLTCFATGAETWLSQPASTDDLTSLIIQGLQFSEANTLFSSKYIWSNLQGLSGDTLTLSNESRIPKYAPMEEQWWT